MTLTDSNNHISQMQKWLLELKEFAHKRIVLCIAGNKCDMVQQRQVDLKDAEAFAKQNNAKHFSTSAKANIGISEMFQYLVTGKYSASRCLAPFPARFELRRSFPSPGLLSNNNHG